LRGPAPRAVFAVATALLAPAARAGELALQVQGGYLDLTHAHRSAEAVFGGARGGPLGGAAVRLGLGDSLFVRLGASYFRRTGERVFVADDRAEPFPLGHPLTVEILPAYLDLARRFHTGLGLHPYLGFGVGGVRLREESDVAGEILTDERTRFSTRTVLGVQAGEGALQLGIELAYARTPGAIGLGGVSKVYGEKDLGGITGTATLTWRP